MHWRMAKSAIYSLQGRGSSQLRPEHLAAARVRWKVVRSQGGLAAARRILRRCEGYEAATFHLWTWSFFHLVLCLLLWCSSSYSWLLEFWWLTWIQLKTSSWLSPLSFIYLMVLDSLEQMIIFYFFVRSMSSILHKIYDRPSKVSRNASHKPKLRASSQEWKWKCWSGKSRSCEHNASQVRAWDLKLRRCEPKPSQVRS